VKLVVEVDGSQHLENRHRYEDERQDAFLAGLGIHVLRFNSREVLLETDAVVEVIYRKLREGMKIPPAPLFQRGDLNE
jgi:very-short-patch-repair endonuclease